MRDRAEDLLLGAYEALLFDMDGTILNSRAAVDRAWSAWAGRMGLPVADVVSFIHGRTALATMRHFLPDLDDLSTELRWLDDREQGDVEGVVEVPGARAFLQALPADRWAVVTSATRALALARIAAAGLPRPPLLITPEDVTHPKPHPESYLKAAGILNAAPEKAIVFEDTQTGMTAGFAAGAGVVQVVGTEGPSTLPVKLKIESYVTLAARLQGGAVELRVQSSAT